MIRLLSVPVLMGAAASIVLHPAPAKLRPWTVALRDQQPDDAFAAVYRTGGHPLVFIAAQHENQNDSLTFRLIRQACHGFRFNTVIAEGFPTSAGPNPPSIQRYVAENGAPKNGFVEGGETVPTALCAEQQHAKLWGGEADDAEVKRRMLAVGFSEPDLLGFYVLRTIPQWIGEHRITNAGDARLESLVDDALTHDRELLHIPPSVLPRFADWASWYERVNRKAIGPGFASEEAGPLADGHFATNRIGAAISRLRDAYLHRLIVRHVNAGESLLVVYGGSHLMIQKPALDAVLGPPCYVGRDLKRAASVCPQG